MNRTSRADQPSATEERNPEMDVPFIETATNSVQALMLAPGAVAYTSLAFRVLSTNRGVHKIRNGIIVATVVAAFLVNRAAPGLPSITVIGVAAATGFVLATGRGPRVIRKATRLLNRLIPA